MCRLAQDPRRYGIQGSWRLRASARTWARVRQSEAEQANLRQDHAHRLTLCCEAYQEAGGRDSGDEKE